MKTTLTIPKKCKVGFNLRHDTYSGRLGYVIYNDGKVWRKEGSWESWREKYVDDETFEQNKLKQFNQRVENYKKSYEQYKERPDWVRNYPTLESYFKYAGVESIETFKYYSGKDKNNDKIIPFEFENEALEGFVLNRKAGGAAGSSSSWNTRDVYCRVYDPRGFEIEINIPNLLYILENTNSIKGKGLEGKFVYAWDGKDLVLLPENAPEFQKIVDFNEVQKLKISKKELVLGGIYLCNGGKNRTYLEENNYYNHNKHNEGKKLWFWNEKYRNKIENYNIQGVKKYLGQDENYAEKIQKLKEFDSYKKPEIEYVEIQNLDTFRPNNTYYHYISKKHNVYILEKNKYKKCELEMYDKHSSYNNILTIGRKEIVFKNDDILKQYTLYTIINK